MRQPSAKDIAWLVLFSVALGSRLQAWVDGVPYSGWMVAIWGTVVALRVVRILVLNKALPAQRQRPVR